MSDDTRSNLSTSTAVIKQGVDIAPDLRSGLGLTVVLALLGTGSRLVIPILLRQIIDNGFVNGQMRTRFVTTLCLLGLLSVFISSVTLRMATARLGTRAERGLFAMRVRLFDHIHRLSLADHNEEKRGALVSRVTSDIETLTRFFSWGGLALLLDGSQMLVVAIVMIAFDWRLAVVAFMVSAPLVFVLRTVQRHLVSAHTKSREKNADLLADVGEMFAGVETIQAYGAEEVFLSRALQSILRRAKANIRAGVIGAFLFPSGEVFATLTVASVIGAGLALGLDSGVTAGALVGFVFLTYRFLEPIAEFTETIDQTQSAVAGLRRVIAVLDTPIGPEEPTRPLTLPSGSLGIEVRDVTFAYRSRGDDENDEPVLTSINLSIAPGEHVAFVGPSGSGKTTLARLISRLVDPLEGSVCIGGVDLRRVANVDLRSRLVVVPQEPFLFATTVAENLVFADPGATRQDVLATFEELSLSDWVASLSKGIDTPVGQRGSSLSAGERQLVALARAFIAAPSILVLDEATSSVDAETEVRMARTFERVARGRTTISVAHRLSTAARADRVVMFANGRIVEQGTHLELIALGGAYSKMYEAWLSATSS
jgi:putative ABC transport system ATP-binding protein